MIRGCVYKCIDKIASLILKQMEYFFLGAADLKLINCADL
jgi:hypothetical protein